MSTRYIVDAEGRPVSAIVDVEELRTVLEAQATISEVLEKLSGAVRDAALQDTPEHRGLIEESVRDLGAVYSGLENARRMLRDLGLPEDLETLEDLEAIRAFDEDVGRIERGEADLLPWEEAKREIEQERAELRRRGEPMSSSSKELPGRA